MVVNMMIIRVWVVHPLNTTKTDTFEHDSFGRDTISPDYDSRLHSFDLKVDLIPVGRVCGVVVLSRGLLSPSHYQLNPEHVPLSHISFPPWQL